VFVKQLKTRRSREVSASTNRNETTNGTRQDKYGSADERRLKEARNDLPAEVFQAVTEREQKVPSG
jgi:hypothetical protein